MERDITFILKRAFFERVCESLAKPKNERELFTYIGQFRNRNIEVLSSPYITNIIVFNSVGEDANVVFRCCGIGGRDEVDPILKQALKEIKLDKTGQTGSESANITALRVILIMAMAYFHNDKEKVKMIYMYYAYSFYYSVFTNYFISKDRINQQCMEYTVNNLTNKFTLKREGSLDGLLYASMTVAVETYTAKFKRLADIDIVHIINAIKTRISHTMRNIRSAYEVNYQKGSRYFETVERNAEGEFIMDRENNLMMVDSLASQYTTSFFQNVINMSSVKTAANMCTVSVNEVRTCISILHDEGDSREVKKFYESLFFLFFDAYPKATNAQVNSAKFLVAADAIYKKGNSNDPNILKIKELSHIWLKRSSNTYNACSRAATQNSFRKAIYTYFVLCVSTK